MMSRCSPPAPALLTRAEAANLLNLSPQTLANWASTGASGLPFVRLSRRAVRYDLAAIREWLQQRTVLHTGQDTNRSER